MKKLLLCLLLLALPILSQTIVRIDPTPVQTVSSNVPPGAFPPVLAVPGATINFCAFPASPSVGACTNFATTFSDSTGSQPCPSNAQVVLPGTNACVATANAQGAFGFWVTAGANYAYTVTLPNGQVYGPYPVTAGTSGGGSSGNYNQGSANAVTQTVTAKLQQYLSLDDFGCVPSNTPSANNTPCQSAINYGIKNGTTLTCQGIYQISASLIPSGFGSDAGKPLIIQGHGSSPVNTSVGCVIQETASVPIFSVVNTTVPGGSQYAVFKLFDITFNGGTYFIYANGDATHGVTISDSVMQRVEAIGQTVANISMNGPAAWQDLYTEECLFSANGAGTVNIQQIASDPTFAAYIVDWESHHDSFGNSDNVFNVDSTGQSRNLEFFNARFVSVRKDIFVAAGFVTSVHFYAGFSSELVHTADVSPLVNAVCSSAGGGTTTLTCASSFTGFVNGQQITIAHGATNPTFGASAPGWDLTTTIASGAGTANLVTTDPIPQAVTNVRVTNALYSDFVFKKSVIAAGHQAPVQITFDEGIYNGNLYGISSPFTSFTLTNNTAPNNVYDPGLNGTVISTGGLTANTAWPWPTTNIPQAVNRTFTSGNAFPTVYRMNPGIGGLTEFCGDGSGTNQCGNSGNYGLAVWQPRGLSWSMVHDPLNGLFINPFIVGSRGGNVVLGSQGSFVSPFTMPDTVGAANALILNNGICTTTPHTGQGDLVVKSGQLHFCDQAGADHTLTGSGTLNPDNGTGTVTGTGCSANAVQDGRGIITLSTATSCTYNFAANTGVNHVCTVTPRVSSGNPIATITAASGAAVTFTLSASTSGFLYYVCSLFY